MNKFGDFTKCVNIVDNLVLYDVGNLKLMAIYMRYQKLSLLLKPTEILAIND